jgi:nucleoside-diphosphate-sugar epimerase
VTGIARNRNDIGEEIEKIECDILDERRVKEVSQSMEKCDACIFFCWSGSKKADRENEQMNQQYADALFTCYQYMAKRFPKALFLQMGSAAEYGISSHFVTEETVCNPISAYGKQKLRFYERAIQYAFHQNVLFVELRLHSVLGKQDAPSKLMMQVIDALQKGRSMKLESDCMQMWNFIGIRDTCEAIRLLIEKRELESGCYNLGGLEDKTLRRFILEAQNYIQEQKGGPGILFGNKKDLLAYDFTYSSKKLQTSIEWSPTEDFMSILKSIVDEGEC